MTTYPTTPDPPEFRRPSRRWPLLVTALLGGLLLGAGATALGMLAAGYERPVVSTADPQPTPSAPAMTTPATPMAEVDPYEVWLERAPDDAPELSRDDALARAFLGCGQDWPPGTTDAILQEVYADHIRC